LSCSLEKTKKWNIVAQIRCVNGLSRANSTKP